MINKSKIELINASITELDKNINEALDKVEVLRQEGSALMIQIIEEEQLLKNTTWELDVIHKTYLSYCGSKKDLVFKPISDLCANIWHTWIDVEDGIQLRFDDENVSLHFDEVRTILPFVNKHKLKINGKNVSDKIRILKHEISTLEQLIHRFSIQS